MKRFTCTPRWDSAWLLILSLALAGLVQAQPLTVIWDKRGFGEHSHFGRQLYALGDQNIDGYSDFAILSSGTGVPGQINEPRFDLFHGGNPPDTIPYFTFKGRQSPYRELWGAQTMGDMNGDGYVDWWIQYGFGAQDDSIVAEFHWGGSAADTIPDFIFGFSADQGYSWIGLLGDFNGDHCSDFYFYDGGVGLSTDVTYIYYGGDPPDTFPDLVIHSNPIGSQSVLPWAFGDLNGDGSSDFITNNNRTPYILRIYFGGSLPDTIPAHTWTDFYLGWTPMITDVNQDGFGDLLVPRVLRTDIHFGGQTLVPTPDVALTFPGCGNGPMEIDPAGDFNGDGYGDVIAISDCNDGFGALRLYLGHNWLNPDPVISVDGATMPLNLIGICHAAGLGDVNGDGIEDLAIGATNQMTYGQGRRGRVVILSGDTTLRVDVTEQLSPIPQEFAVQICPNPFNSQTTIILDLPTFTAKIDLIMYNVLGQDVRHTELRNVLGRTIYHFDGADLPTGVYLLRVQADHLTNIQKLLLVR